MIKNAVDKAVKGTGNFVFFFFLIYFWESFTSFTGLICKIHDSPSKVLKKTANNFFFLDQKNTFNHLTINTLKHTS